MSKILIAGAGGAPSEGVIKSILAGKRSEEVIGMGADPTDLLLSAASSKYYVPYANHPNYKDTLMSILGKERPDLVHFQNDLEVYHASIIRDDILNTGVKLFMPEHDVIDKCVNKYKSYLAFKSAGVPVPDNILIKDFSDLKLAFKELSDENGCIWLRSTSLGGGGIGSIPTSDIDMANAWINHHKGWGKFLAANMLTSKTVTWVSIWHNGNLIVAQTRERRGWVHGNRSISGVTGVTKVGVTVNDKNVDNIALAAIMSVSNKPHGIFGVDMTYDRSGVPNVTEINISRFFTTVLFFTFAGLNLPEIFKDIILYNHFPTLKKIINPLPTGMMWLRGMDTAPKLSNQEQIDNEIQFL